MTNFSLFDDKSIINYLNSHIFIQEVVKIFKIKKYIKFYKNKNIILTFFRKK